MFKLAAALEIISKTGSGGSPSYFTAQNYKSLGTDGVKCEQSMPWARDFTNPSS